MGWHHVKQVAIAVSLLAVTALGVSVAHAQVSGSRHMLSIQTGSMVPALHKGDLVIVNRVPAGQLAVGDVITFVNPKDRRGTVTHRIVQLPSAANQHRIVTKGDANNAADTPITAGLVVGKVSRHVPLAGYLTDFTHTPLGLALLVYVPALGVIISEMKRLAQYYKQQLYRAPGYVVQSQGMPLAKKRLAAIVGAFAFGVASVVAIALPAQAALFSTATLTGNSISATKPAAAGHILLRSVEFECSLDNTGQLNKLPGILFYNPTKADIRTGGWYLQSSKGRILTMPAKTVFDSRDNFDIEPDLRDGIDYNGDYLALFDNTGKVVDAISWGTDTTYLNPALPGTLAGTAFRRVSLVTDTDTAADWAVSVSPCVAVRE